MDVGCGCATTGVSHKGQGGGKGGKGNGAVVKWREMEQWETHVMIILDGEIRKVNSISASCIRQRRFGSIK